MHHFPVRISFPHCDFLHREKCANNVHVSIFSPCHFSIGPESFHWMYTEYPPGQRHDAKAVQTRWLGRLTSMLVQFRRDSTQTHVSNSCRMIFCISSPPPTHLPPTQTTYLIGTIYLFVSPSIYHCLKISKLEFGLFWNASQLCGLEKAMPFHTIPIYSRIWTNWRHLAQNSFKNNTYILLLGQSVKNQVIQGQLPLNIS